MQKLSSSRRSALVLLLIVSLIASACGGSDDGSDSASDPEAVSTSSSDADSPDDSDTDDGDSSAGDSTESATSDTATASSPTAETRDCAYVSVDDDVEEAEPQPEDVPLPPQEKPPVDEELLGSFDELIVTDLIEGTGAVANAGDTISMQYVGVLASDGTEFDSSWDRGAEPFVFTLGAGGVIEGWDVGIEGMKVGGRRILQIPSAQAYGDTDRSEVIVANSDLIFIVDMVEVSAGVGQPAPEIEADLLGSFGDLVVTDLVVGDGCEARVGDIMVVNYVGQNAADGVEIDNSWARGDTFRLTAGMSQVIDGWNEGLVGMKVGGERILQIPASKAYNESDLVFRIHLEEIIDAPYAHTLTFDGDAPDDLEITTVTEGSGDGAEAGDFLEANIAVLVFSSGDLVQSTWEAGQPTQLALQEGALLPGLEQGVTGIAAGELRQIVVPNNVAYPDGVPEGAGLEDDDAIVFVIEAVSVTKG